MRQCRGETDTLTGPPLTLPFVELDGMPQVRMVDFETVEQLSLPAHVFPVGIFSDGKKGIGMRLSYQIGLWQLLQSLRGELVDGLQHGEAGIPRRAFLLPQQT